MKATPVERRPARLVGGVAHSMILRAPVLLIAPLAPELMQEFSVTSTQVSLLTSVPVITFGLLAATGQWAAQRRGLSWMLVAGAILIGVGCAVRASGGFTIALIGTVILGLGIAWGNVALPLVVQRDYPRHAAQATGVSTAILNVGSSAATIGVTAVAFLAGWRVALLLPLPIAMLAAAAWAWDTRRRRPDVSGPASAPETGPDSVSPDELDALDASGGGKQASELTIWLLAVAFGGHVIAYYACSAWLPTYFRTALGFTPDGAAGATMIFHFTAIAGPLLAGALAAAGRLMRVTVAIGVCWLALPIGLLVAPSAWLVWLLLAGFAQGGAFTIVMTMAIGITQGPRELARASSRIQGASYVVAAFGPLMVGALLDLDAGWWPAFAAIGVLVGVMFAALVWATARSRAVLGRPGA